MWNSATEKPNICLYPAHAELFKRIMLQLVHSLPLKICISKWIIQNFLQHMLQNSINNNYNMGCIFCKFVGIYILYYCSQLFKIWLHFTSVIKAHHFYYLFLYGLCIFHTFCQEYYCINICKGRCIFCHQHFYIFSFFLGMFCYFFPRRRRIFSKNI